MQKTKIAVIGVGGISEFHLKAYAKNPDVELYALCDIDETQLKKRGAEFGVSRLFGDCETMLRELPEIEAVSVCTWNSAHAPCSIAALRAGKHVLCEKPMAISTEEALKMKEAAEMSGKLLMIGFVLRFGKDCEILKELIDGGEFGDVYWVKAQSIRRKGSPGGWFSDKSRAGGGPLIDLGVHIIDKARYLLGNPKPVSVYGATFKKLLDRPDVKDGVGYKSVSASNNDIFDVEDAATALVRYDNGSVFAVETSYSLNAEGSGGMEFFGTKAGAKLDQGLKIYSALGGYMTNAELATSPSTDFSVLFENEINHFVDCVRTGAPCRNPAEDGVEIMRILDGVYESARTGHEVVLQ